MKIVTLCGLRQCCYRQLCVTEGIYTCRAPSCQICVDYDNCFAPED